MESKEMAAKLIQQDENFSQHIYVLNGIRHIGWGFNLDDVGLYKEEADFILQNRISSTEAELIRNFSGFEELSVNRKAILIDLCYMLGISRLMQFRDFIEHTKKGEWALASTALLDSLAAKQNPARMERLAYGWELDKI